MESNNPIIAKCLDDLITGKISREEADSLFLAHNIMAPEEMIERHTTAAVAIQRFGLQKQVEQMHRSFMASRALTSPEKIQTAADTNKSMAKVVRMPMRKMILRIAAALFFVCICSFSYLWISNTSPKLYSELYAPYNVVVERGAAGNNGAENIVALYQQKNYTEVLKIYKQSAAAGNRDKFLAAMSAMQINDNAAAVGILQALLAHNQTTGSRLYNDHASYYLMLNLLQQKQYNDAIEIAEKINNDSFHIYHEKVNSWTIFKMKWLR
jgi:tetratricopeptide (TPR) repeat protein